MSDSKANSSGDIKSEIPLLGIFTGLLAGLFWGMVFVTPKLLPEVDTTLLALGRYLMFGVCAFFGGLAGFGQLKNLKLRDWLAAFGLSMLGYSVYYAMLAKAVRLVGVSIASLVIGLLPLMIVLSSGGLTLARQFTQQKRQQFFLSLLLILLGIGFVNFTLFWKDASTVEFVTVNALDKWIGLILLILALASWTAFAVLNAKYLKANRHISSVQWSNLLGVFSALSMLIIGRFLLPDVAIIDSFVTNRPLLLASIVVGVGSSWFATWLWNITSQRLPSALAGQLIVSETVFALLYGFIIDRRFPDGFESAAIVFLISGVLLGIRAFR